MLKLFAVIIFSLVLHVCRISANANQYTSHSQNVALAGRGIDALETLEKQIKKHMFSAILSKNRMTTLSTNILALNPNLLSALEKERNATLLGSYKTAETALGTYTKDSMNVRRLLPLVIVKDTNLAEYEMSLRALHTNFYAYLDAIGTELETLLRANFIVKYKSDFSSSTEGLHRELQRLLLSSRQVTGEHRLQIQAFGLYMLQLLMQGLGMEMSYLHVEYGSSSSLLGRTAAQWMHRLELTRMLLVEQDREAESQWSAQQVKDVQHILQSNVHLSNKEFIGKLFKFLKEKYYWRFWGVVTYKESPDSKEHAVNECGGGQHTGSLERSVVWGSQDKWDSTFDKAKAEQLLAGLENKDNEASSVLNEVNNLSESACSPFSLKAAVCWGCDVWYTSDAGHNAYVKVETGKLWWKKYYNVMIFG